MKKTLYISFYILYIGERMSQSNKQKIRIGKQEKVVLRYLELNPHGVWYEDLINLFSFSAMYKYIMWERLNRMVKKGLIQIKEEINPQTGRMKKRVYLIK